MLVLSKKMNKCTYLKLLQPQLHFLSVYSEHQIKVQVPIFFYLYL